MKRETLVWTILLVLGALFLVGRAAFTEHGMGKAYVQAVPVNPDDPDPAHRWMSYENALPRDYAQAERENPDQTEYRFSLSRTIGTWIAAFFTLFVLSFLYKDNPFYKVAEAVVIGVSAAYWMVVGFWTTLVPNLLGKLAPGWVKSWAMPGLDASHEWAYVFPLILGVMLLMRLSPTASWISRWPLSSRSGSPIRSPTPFCSGRRCAPCCWSSASCQGWCTSSSPSSTRAWWGRRPSWASGT
jgi:hypothetical protein